MALNQVDPAQLLSEFDINAFLRELPAVQAEDLSSGEDDLCSICLVKHYDENPYSFQTENPCRLPCGHIVGRACIARWLRPHPEGFNANTCVVCRQRLFRAWPANPGQVVADENENEQNVLPRAERRTILPPGQAPPNLIHQEQMFLGEEPSGEQEELNAADPEVGDWMRRIALHNAQAVRMEGPLGLQANLYPAGDIQRMEEQGIDLPGVRQPRNAGQEAIERNARFGRATQQHGYVSFLEVAPAIAHERANAEQQRPSYYIRVVEQCGFYMSPNAQRPHTAHEVGRLLRQRAENLAMAAYRQLDLYTTLMTQGVPLPQSEDPGNGFLDHHQEDALFQWLQDQNAFRGVAFNEAYRMDHGTLQGVRARTNREIFEMLRECGVFWELHSWGKGRWRTRECYLFDEEEERLSESFQALLPEDAFADQGVNRLFPGANAYYIFRRLVEMGAVWHSQRRQWSRHCERTGRNVVVR